MPVSPPGGDPNAQLYEQLKRDVLERVPHIRTIEYVPDPIEAKHLKAIFVPDRLDPPTGPADPTLLITWYRGTPTDWFRVDYHDPNTDFHAGWHQDGDHPGLGDAHFQYSSGDDQDRWAITFAYDTPSRILWEIIEELLTEVLPNYP